MPIPIPVKPQTARVELLTDEEILDIETGEVVAIIYDHFLEFAMDVRDKPEDIAFAIGVCLEEF